MKLSLNWLNDYVDLTGKDPAEIALRLTMTCCEVDETIQQFAHLSSVLVGKVVAKKPHPDADKLSVCEVDLGKRTEQIVCGAPNVDAGQLVPVAPVGCVLPGDFKIKKTKIRGVESHGMICSEAELEFSAEAEGIMVLDPERGFEIGRALVNWFPRQDTIFDIDNKSITHRPDLWSHFGFARELAAIYDLPLKKEPGLPEEGWKLLEEIQTDGVREINIDIRRESARAYCGLVVTNLPPAGTLKSPAWLTDRLEAVGAKPINLLVDLSNYVMFDIGQPNHAFDANTIEKEIVVDFCDQEIDFTTLDGNKRQIPQQSVMIYDGEKPVALGGIMGGAETEISDDTVELFLESANFNRRDIRRTLPRLGGLRTDAAIRFEKGLAPENAARAIFRFVELLRQVVPEIKAGRLVEKIASDPFAGKDLFITIKPDYLRARLGEDLPDDKLRVILEKLHFEVETKKDGWQVRVPWFRRHYDVEVPIDLVEEVGRSYGYDHISGKPPVAPVEPPRQPNQIKKWRDETVDLFSDRYGYTEVCLYSFCVEAEARAGLNDWPAGKKAKPIPREPVELANPTHQEQAFMRTSLVPGLARAAVLNEERFDEFRLFELGRVYSYTGMETPDAKIRKPFLSDPVFGRTEDHREEFQLGAIHVPRRRGDHREANFRASLEARSVVEDYLRQLGLNQYSTRHESERPWYHGGLAVAYEVKGQVVAYVGLVHPRLQKELGLKRDAIITQMNLSALWQLAPSAIQRWKWYQPPSVFPSVHFEFTIVVKDGQSSGPIRDIVADLKFSELTRLELVDEYRGEPLAGDEQALSFRVEFSSRDQTLTPERIQAMQDAIVAALEKAGYPLRS